MVLGIWSVNNCLYPKGKGMWAMLFRVPKPRKYPISWPLSQKKENAGC